jgi:hypothetical protein
MKLLDCAPLRLCVSVSLCSLTSFILASYTRNRAGAIPETFPLRADFAKNG